MNENRDPKSGFPPGSIGDLSVRVGYDVRDLKIMGYSWNQIHAVAQGQMTLKELLASKPEDRAPRRRRCCKPNPAKHK